MGRARPTRSPSKGRDAVARLFVSVAGHPPAGMAVDGSPFAVLVLDITPDTDQVIGIYSITNPDN